MKIAFSLAIFAMLCIGGLAIIGEDANDADDVVVVADPCTINYIVDSTVYAVDETIKDGKVTLSTALPTGAIASEGKEFSGWLYNGNVVKSITAESGTTYTVTAVFSDIEYSVAFVYGTTVDTESYTYGDEVTVPEDVEAPTGYEFVGWSNGTATITTIPAVTANATYSAVFTPMVVEYTVTFMVDGEQYGAVQTVASASEIVYPYIEGYTWGDVVTDKETGNMTVTAVANPVADDSIFGLDTTSAVLLIMIFAVLVCILIVWLKKEGFIFGGKSE